MLCTSFMLPKVLNKYLTKVQNFAFKMETRVGDGCNGCYNWPHFYLKWGIMGRKGDRMYQYSIPQCITFTPFPSHSTITWKSTAYAILLFVDCYNCPQFPLFHTFFPAHTGQNIHSTHNKSQQNQSNSKIHSIKRKTKKIQKDKNLGLVYIKPRYPSKMTFNYINFTWWGNLRLYFCFNMIMDLIFQFLI